MTQSSTTKARKLETKTATVQTSNNTDNNTNRKANKHRTAERVRQRRLTNERKRLTLLNQHLNLRVESLKKKLELARKVIRSLSTSHNSNSVQKISTTTQTPPESLLHQYEQRILFNNPNTKQLIGMSSEAFEDLYAMCTTEFARITQHGKDRKEWPIDQQPAISDRHQLLITLHWMRQYRVLVDLSLEIGVHQRTISRIISRCCRVLALSLAVELRWPTEQQIAALCSANPDPVVTGLEKGAFVVDCTRFLVPRPFDKLAQRLYYSGKTKTHNINMMFVITRDGHCVYVSPPYPGRYHDQRIFNDSNLRAALRDKGYGIVGDRGYTFNRTIDTFPVKSFSPSKRTPGVEMSKEQKEKNQRISSLRVRIEHYFAHLKQWRVFKSKFRLYSASRHNVINFSFLVNTIVRIIEWLGKRKIQAV